MNKLFRFLFIGLLLFAAAACISVSAQVDVARNTTAVNIRLTTLSMCSFAARRVFLA